MARAAGNFAMASYSSTPATWSRMDEGAAASHWRPRTTVEEAIKKCLLWTGRIAIPAMQVIDLASGEVVWRDSRHYPQAGACIPEGRHEWEKVSSGAWDPAAVELGCEKNMMIFVDERWPRGFHKGFPICEGCGRHPSIGPFSHYCVSCWFEGCDELWPEDEPEQLQLFASFS